MMRHGGFVMQPVDPDSGAMAPRNLSEILGALLTCHTVWMFPPLDSPNSPPC